LEKETMKGLRCWDDYELGVEEKIIQLGKRSHGLKQRSGNDSRHWGGDSRKKHNGIEGGIMGTKRRGHLP